MNELGASVFTMVLILRTFNRRNGHSIVAPYGNCILAPSIMGPSSRDTGMTLLNKFLGIRLNLLSLDTRLSTYIWIILSHLLVSMGNSR